MGQNKRVIGSEYEERAIAYLIEQGYGIIEKNYRTYTGEIDIIARDIDVLCFIEVKYRKNTKMGYPSESIDKNKQHRIYLTAMAYMTEHKISDNVSCRFDAVLVLGDNIRLEKNIM